MLSARIEMRVEDLHIHWNDLVENSSCVVFIVGIAMPNSVPRTLGGL